MVEFPLSSNAATAIASNADAADSDAELFRLEVEFNEACVLWEAAGESVDDIEWENRRKALSAAIAEVDRTSQSSECPRLSHHRHARTYSAGSC